MLPDRRVHAECWDYEVVRYDRSGHWYLEPRAQDVQRSVLNVRQAVEHAKKAKERRGGKVHFGVPGGDRFEKLFLA